MIILHIISNEEDRTRAERVTRYMSETFEHQYVTANELSAYQGDVDVVHAHRWFECGQAAWNYAAAKHLSYVVDVMQSDVEAYRKLFVFNRKSAENVLLEAVRVIFTSPSQQDFLAQHLPSKTADSVFFHSTLIYEALDPFWITNIHIHPPTALVHIKLLHVGTSDSNSHLDVVHHAMKKLQRRNYDISLTTVEIFLYDDGVLRQRQLMIDHFHQTCQDAIEWYDIHFELETIPHEHTLHSTIKVG